MKRLNPNTGEPFKHGDVRADGKRFHGYNLTFVRKDGYFSEQWMSEERFSEYSRKNKTKKIKSLVSPNDTKLKEIAKIKINPLTMKEYQVGDLNTDGDQRVVKIDHELIDNEGFAFVVFAPINEEWLVVNKNLLNLISDRLVRAKSRAKKKNIPFELTKGYLYAIFPRDLKCPALGLPFELHENVGEDVSEISERRSLSPSLDRILPELGYVEGNVAWISFKANAIKTDANADEINRVSEWLRDIAD